jgi:predicted porin
MTIKFIEPLYTIYLDKNVNYQSIIKNALFGSITFALTQPALAVTDEEFKTLQEQFNLLAEQVEQNSKTSTSNTTVGGYGELHYNNLSDGQGTDNKMLDFHRFVLFFNHEFNDKIRLFSEVEIEHALAGDGQPGEVEVEQAYVQFDIGENSNIDAGLFLIPVGILNETHEPPTFYGVERNPVEKNIIPTTWWEGGAMFSSRYDSGIRYDIALTSGLDGGTSIRGGRQKVAKATANNLAATARVKYTGTRGLELAATVQYQDDMTQDTSDDVGSATMIETHARWSIADFTLTGLYARWDIDVADTAAQSDKDKESQDGAYIEASYKPHPEWGVFVRQNQWDNGGTGDTKRTQTDVGVNYWPHENVVIKADYQAQNDNDDGAGFDGFNMGIGYQF